MLVLHLYDIVSLVYLSLVYLDSPALTFESRLVGSSGSFFNPSFCNMTRSTGASCSHLEPGDSRFERRRSTGRARLRLAPAASDLEELVDLLKTWNLQSLSNLPSSGSLEVPDPLQAGHLVGTLGWYRGEEAHGMDDLHNSQISLLHGPLGF